MLPSPQLARSTIVISICFWRLRSTRGRNMAPRLIFLLRDLSLELAAYVYVGVNNCCYNIVVVQQLLLLLTIVVVVVVVVVVVLLLLLLL
jgi:hypothetical protein